jgi:hypothetical protein
VCACVYLCAFSMCVCVCVYRSMSVSQCVRHSVCTGTVPVCVCIIVCVHGTMVSVSSGVYAFFYFFKKKDLEYAGDVVGECYFAPKFYFGSRLPGFANTPAIFSDHIFWYNSTVASVHTNVFFSYTNVSLMVAPSSQTS